MSQFTIEAILKATGAAEFAKGFENAAKSMGDFDRLAGGMKNVGSKMTKGITLPLAALAGGAIVVGKGYEESMSNVQAISGATGGELDKLRETARQMGATTRYSAKNHWHSIKKFIAKKVTKIGEF